VRTFLRLVVAVPVPSILGAPLARSAAPALGGSGAPAPALGGSGAPVVVAGSRSVRRLGWAAVVVLVAALGGLFGVRALTGSSAAGSAAGARSVAAHGLASLPLAARLAVSRGLGADARQFDVHGLSGGGLVAHAGGLSARFAASGVSVTGAGGALHLALSAIGRGNALRAVGAAAPDRLASNKVGYAHAGVSEWYATGPLGLEQGFTVRTRPAGAGPLLLGVGRLPAGVSGRVLRGGRSLVLSRDGRALLRYGDLSVTSASGARVPATVTLRGRELLLQVQDAGARYPLSIDPLAQLAVLTSSDGQPNDHYGGAGNIGGTQAVAIAGDTIVVGASGEEFNGDNNGGDGAVYVYTEPAGGWANATQTAELTLPSTDHNDQFGSSVAISGGTIVAGAPAEDCGAGSDCGAAYVFTEPAGGWTSTSTPTAELTASDAAANDYFGQAVAIDGSTVVVGSPGASGAAYVFSEPAGGWATATQTAKLTASDGAAGDNFGSSVAVSGSTVVAGAPNHKVGSNNAQGAAYVFSEPAGGWANSSTAAELTSSDGEVDDLFGFSVAVSGQTIAVGAYYNPQLSTNQGAVYVFSEPAGGWATATQTAKLTASDAVGFDQFGQTVAIDPSTNTIYAGAPAWNSSSGQSIGGVYAFAEPSGGWVDASETATYDVNDPSPNDFGWSVAASGGTLVVSAPSATVGSNSSQGEVYVYGAPPAPVNTAAPMISGTPVQGDQLAVSRGSWTNSPTSYSYQWEDCDSSGADCAAISGATAPVYTLTAGDVGHTIVAEVTASNGTPSAPASSAPTAVVVPLAPVDSSPPVISGTLVQGQTLSASPGSWSNSPTAYAYQWEQCDSSGTGCTAIAGATGSTYVLSAGDVGHTIVVQVTASNAGGPGAPASSAASGVISAPPPSATAPKDVSAPVISGTAVSGYTLSASEGTWTGTAPISYAYQWQRCTSSGCVSIAGATHGSYVPSAADLGRRLRVLVTASNSAGSVQAGSGEAGPVAAATPAQARAALSKVLAPRGRAASPKRVLKAGGYTFAFHAPSAGRLTIRWYERKGHRQVLIASASHSFHAAGSAKVKVRLTGAGRRLLRHGKRVRLTARASFTPAGGPATTRTRTFKL
jgi:hypothetical protein